VCDQRKSQTTTSVNVNFDASPATPRTGSFSARGPESCSRPYTALTVESQRQSLTARPWTSEEGSLGNELLRLSTPKEMGARPTTPQRHASHVGTRPPPIAVHILHCEPPMSGSAAAPMQPAPWTGRAPGARESTAFGPLPTSCGGSVRERLQFERNLAPIGDERVVSHTLAHSRAQQTTLVARIRASNMEVVKASALEYGCSSHQLAQFPGGLPNQSWVEREARPEKDWMRPTAPPTPRTTDEPSPRTVPVGALATPTAPISPAGPVGTLELFGGAVHHFDASRIYSASAATPRHGAIEAMCGKYGSTLHTGGGRIEELAAVAVNSEIDDWKEERRRHPARFRPRHARTNSFERLARGVAARPQRAGDRPRHPSKVVVSPEDEFGGGFERLSDDQCEALYAAAALLPATRRVAERMKLLREQPYLRRMAEKTAVEHRRHMMERFRINFVDANRDKNSFTHEAMKQQADKRAEKRAERDVRVARAQASMPIPRSVIPHTPQLASLAATTSHVPAAPGSSKES